MKKRTGWLGLGIAGFFLISLVFSLGAGSVLAAEELLKTPQQAAELAAPAAPHSVTISGTVVALGKDAQGKLISVGIRTEKEGEYLVLNEGKGADLMNMLNEKVQVTGAVHERMGKKNISVTQYELIKVPFVAPEK